MAMEWTRRTSPGADHCKQSTETFEVCVCVCVPDWATMGRGGHVRSKQWDNPTMRSKQVGQNSKR